MCVDMNLPYLVYLGHKAIVSLTTRPRVVQVVAVELYQRQNNTKKTGDKMTTLREVLYEIAQDPRGLAINTAEGMWNPLTYIDEAYSSTREEIADQEFDQEAVWVKKEKIIRVWDDERDQWKSLSWGVVCEGNWNEQDEFIEVEL